MAAVLCMILMGSKVKEMKYFEEDFQLFELDQLLKKDDSIKHPTGEKYFYSAKEVGTGEDILAYLTNDKNIDEIYHALDSWHKGLF